MNPEPSSLEHHVSGSTVSTWPRILAYIEGRPDQTLFTWDELSSQVDYDLKKSRGSLVRVKAALAEQGRFVITQDVKGIHLSPPQEVAP